MNCQDALNLLYDIIDKEASEIDAHQVQEHLKKCHHCFEVFRLESSVKELIQERVAHHEPTPRVTQLRDKILTQLDGIDAEQKDRKRKPPFGNVAFTLAAAAFLVVALGGAYLLAGFYRHNDLYIPFEQAHWNVSAQMGRLASADESSALLPGMADSLQYEISDAVAGFQLLGGYPEKLSDCRMAHFVYQQEQSLVSVFVVCAKQFQIPDNVRTAAVHSGELTMYDHNCRGCRLVFHQTGNVVVITATTDRSVDLTTFVPGHSLTTGAI